MQIIKGKSNMTLFHLSEKPLPKIIYPRVPDNFLTQEGIEDNTIPRVCFSPSILHCLMAKHNSNNKKYFVYEPLKYGDLEIIENREIVKNNLVPDAEITKEIWSVAPVELKLIGMIKPLDSTGYIKEITRFINKDNVPIKFKMEIWGFDWINLSWSGGDNLDSKNTYKNEEGDNDVILLRSVSQEEIELKMKQRREEFKKTVEKLTEMLNESKNRVKGVNCNEWIVNNWTNDR